MPDNRPDFRMDTTNLPSCNFEAIAGHHYLNSRAIVFLLEFEDGHYERWEYCFEIQNDTLSTQLDFIEFDIGRAAFFSDWTPGFSRPCYAICGLSGTEQTLPIVFAYRHYNEEGEVIAQVDSSFNNVHFPAGQYKAIDILDYTTSVAKQITAVNYQVNNNTISQGNKKPLFIVGEGVPIEHANTSSRSYDAVDVETFEATVNGQPIEPENEYEYGGTSGPGGGQGGSFDNSSDAIDFSPLPTGGAAASGLVTMYHPTSSQMAAFGNFLWGSLFESGFDGLLTSLKKWVNDPIESIIQLSAFPVTPPTGGAKTVKFCGISSDLVGTGVTMNTVTSQFMSFDFGSITVPAYWKQALDYTPYSKVSIFLPFCGIQPLNADDIIDATLHLKYNIDLLTGIFSAELKVTKTINGTPLNSVLYNWSGNMAVQIPITASNFSQVFGSLMSTVAAAGIGAISGGLGAAAAGAETTATAGALSGAGHGIAANIGNVVNSKPHVQHGGRLDGSAGSLSSFTPYLIIERPVQSLSANFQKEQGYPSNIVQRLGDLSGMTVCEAPILDGIPCTDNERQMLYNLLCGGVII